MSQERKQAFDILNTCLNQKIALQPLFARTKLSPFSKELVYGVCRYYVRLNAIAEALMPKPLKDASVNLIVLMGLYQLEIMGLPDYAVVKESVDLLPRKKNWAKALINAVLRRFCRERVEILQNLASNTDYLINHPKPLLKQLKTDWPEDWQAICLANDQHAPMSLRVNSQKTNRLDYQAMLLAQGIESESLSYSPNALLLKQAQDVYDLPHFAEGFVSVQDEAAQMAVQLLDLGPGLSVLDACAAPGGKTCHILENQSQLSRCVALDIDEYRLIKVRENLSRLGLVAALQQGDATQPEQWWDGQAFDRILLDAPCSATGVIRRHPDIKLLRTSDEIKQISQVQASCLEALWPLLSNGGRLVYATCSIMKQENEQQIAAFMAKHADCVLWPIPMHFGRDTGYGRQILPGDSGMDGFFYSVLLKQTERSR